VLLYRYCVSACCCNTQTSSQSNSACAAQLRSRPTSAFPPPSSRSSQHDEAAQDEQRPADCDPRRSKTAGACGWQSFPCGVGRRPEFDADCIFPLQAVDSAKKRAVYQHVDYDTFRNMVRCTAAAIDRRRGMGARSGALPAAKSARWCCSLFAAVLSAPSASSQTWHLPTMRSTSQSWPTS